MIARCLLLAALPLLCATSAQARVTLADWGKTANGQSVPLLTIDDGHAQVDVTPLGARLLAWRVPDSKGVAGNVLVGPTAPAKMTGLMSVAGATIGRYANRIGHGHLVIDDEQWALAINNRGNTLHGGPEGFSTKLWTMRKLADGAVFSLVSPEGDMGFPGTLTVSVTYRLIRRGKGDELSIRYRATTDRPTVINLTNHAFFDLSAGQGAGRTTARIAATRYAATDPASGLPTGQLAPVAGKPWDFSSGRLLPGNAMMDVSLVLDRPGAAPVASFADAASGRRMAVFTDQPSAQLFVPVKDSAPWAFCFETEHLPDSPNQSAFPSTVLRPGQVFTSTTRYVISAGR